MDAYTPFPIHDLSDALDFHDNRVPWIVFVGGLLGCIGGISLQIYVSAIDYPINAGGKPLISLPAFLPVTFECTVLLAGLSAFLSVLVLNKLPMPYHPVFNVAGFERASMDRFFLCIESRDKQFESENTKSFLENLEPIRVSEVVADAGYVEEYD
jgi:hypothetical protein